MKKKIEAALNRLGYEVVPKWRAAHHAQARYLQQLFDLLAIDCVLDVGANTGQFRDFLRVQVGYTGRIVSFEPIPDCVAELQRRSATDSAWEVRPIALGSHAGTASFNITKETQFSSLREPDASVTSRFEALNSVVSRIEVEVNTLENVLPQIRQAGISRIYLKLDTQGFDLEVIRGAGECLTQVEAIQTELSFIRLYEGSPGWAETIDELRSRGFRLSGLFPNNPQHFPDCYEMDCHMIHSRWSAEAAGKNQDSAI
ncbi:MAG: FkbM family methyltransferase [Vicinamibacterales bacterium]